MWGIVYSWSPKALGKHFNEKALFKGLFLDK